MRRKIYFLLSFGLAAMIIAVLLLFFWREATRDPLEGMVIPLGKVPAGDTKEWDAIHDLSGSGDPLDARFQNIPGEMRTEVLSTSTNADGETVDRLKVTIPWKQRKTEEYQFAFEPITLSAPDFSWQEGPVKLSVREFQFEDYRLEEDPQNDKLLQAQYYRPAQGAATWDEEPPDGSYRPDYEPDNPRNVLKLTMHVEASERFRATHQPVYDRRTYQKVCQSWGISSGTKINCSYFLTALHDILPLAVADVFLGPPEVHEWNPRENPVLETADFRVHYIGSMPGDFSRLKRHYGSREERFEVDLDYIEEPGQSMHIFSVSPQEAQLRLDFDFDEIGAQGRGGGWLSGVRFFNLEIPEDQLATVKIKYYPHAKRVFTEAPTLPVDPVNRRLENGLDLRFPFITIQSRYDFFQKTSDALGLNGYTAAGGPAPDPNFPLTYENITVRELLQEYLAHYPDQTIEYDPIEHKLAVRVQQKKPKPWEPAVEWVQEKIKKP